MAKKHKKHEEHANHERWLVSYADFITLLFAFFVVMFSASQVDRSKTNKLALAVEAAFSTFSIFKDSGGQLNIMASPSKVSSTSSSATSSKTYVASEEGDPIFMPPAIYNDEEKVVDSTKGDGSLSEHTGVPTSEEEALGRTQRNLIEMIDKKKLQGAVVVGTDERGIVISLREAGIFDSGAEKMTPISYEILEGVGRILARLPNQVRIEGHSDNQKVAGNFPSNWELSAARASNVLRWLIDRYELEPARFSAVGYGEYRPSVSNETPEGRMRNRRVDIIILSEKAAEKEAPMPPRKSRSRKG